MLEPEVEPGMVTEHPLHVFGKCTFSCSKRAECRSSVDISASVFWGTSAMNTVR